MACFRRLRSPAPVASAFASCLVLATSLAHAQDGTGVPTGAAGAQAVPADPPPKPGVPVPPKIKTKVEPVYPPEKLAAGETATVKLELTLDAAGKVTNAKILESGGAEFDASALDAARKLEFEPASVDGKPIPSKIPWRFTFDFQDVPKPKAPGEVEKPAQPVGELEIVVKTPVDDPLPGATVTLTGTPVAGAEPVTQKSVTDIKGRAVFRELPPGKWRVQVAAEGFKTFEVEETIDVGKRVQATYRPKLSGDAIDIEVKGERPPREVTVHTLNQEEITRVPGSNGDALRAVQNLPGVARPPALAGFLIIRGAAPQESNIFIDGTLVPIAYHFGGLSSVVPSELLERIDFRPGNFGPEYGRVTGGIIDIGLRSPKKDRLHGLLQFDLVDGRTVIEGPIDEKTRFAVGGRRSWVDAWLGPVLRSVGVGVSTAPVYYDYQAILERDVTKNVTARLAFFGSDDRLAITLNTPAAGDPLAGGDLTTGIGFWRIQGRVEQRLSDNLKWTNSLAYGADYLSFSAGDNYFQLYSNPLTWRSDVRAKLSKEATFVAGLDYLRSSYDVSVKFPPPPAPGESSGPFFARPARELRGEGALYRPAAYAMLDLSPVKGLRLLPGVRVDYTRDSQSWNVGPRFAARYDVVQGFPRTTLTGGAGVFHQAPQPQESLPPFGQAGVQNARATHYGLGFEQEFTKQVELSVEGFYKDLQRLVTRELAETSTAGGVLYANRGDGRVFGAEVLLRYKSDSRFFGWLAYTLSRAERRLKPEDPMSLFQWDQTHILTVLGSYKLGRGWQVGARFRYVSGRMYTPLVGGVADFDAGAYAAIPSVPPFGARIAPFHQLDVRVDKEWDFKSWKLAAYLDVLIVYNRQNPEGVSYNYNFTQSTSVTGLPILPVLGLRGEL